MFGGLELDTLYVTTMRTTLDDAQLAEEPLAGCLLAIGPGVKRHRRSAVLRLNAALRKRAERCAEFPSPRIKVYIRHTILIAFGPALC
jgi:hypothetical protein